MLVSKWFTIYQAEANDDMGSGGGGGGTGGGVDSDSSGAGAGGEAEQAGAGEKPSGGAGVAGEAGAGADGQDGSGKGGGAGVSKATPKPGEPANLLEAISSGLKPADQAAAKAAKDAAAAAAAEAAKGKGDQPAAGDKAKPAAKPKAGEIDLTPPAGITPDAQARFQRLATGYKELQTTHAETTTKLQQSEQIRQEFANVLKEGRVESADLVQFVDFNKAVKTGNWDRALQILDTQREAVAKLAGREVPGVDLLKDFPDLQKDVQDHAIAKERALEIAKQRREAAARSAQDAQTRTSQQTQQAETTKRKQAADQVVAWAKQKASSDIDYSAKETKILEQLDRIMQKYPPETWLEQIEDRYALIQVVGGSGPKPTSGQQPLRPSGGGGVPEPGSLLEAVTSGLAAARRVA